MNLINIINEEINTLANENNVAAYQGSTANHDGYDIKKIGTGEGNVVFGFGFYFTSCYGIAKFYEDSLWVRKAFKPSFLKNFVAWVTGDKYNPYKKQVYRDIVNDHNTDISGIIDLYSNKGDSGKEILNFLRENLVNEKTPKVIYSVSLSLKNPIYWDENNNNNNNNIVKILQTNGISVKTNNGEQIYKEVSKLKGGFKKASEFLNLININSIIYGAGTRSGMENSDCINYVLFNHNDVKITNKKVS